MLVELPGPFALGHRITKSNFALKKYDTHDRVYIELYPIGIETISDYSLMCFDVIPRVWNASDCASVLVTYFL